MVVGLLVIAGLLLAVPVGAYALARRLPPPRRREVQPDREYDWARRHRLGAHDHIRIKEAVAAGRRVEPERLVPAAREWAEIVLSPEPLLHTLHQRHPWRWRLLAAAYLVFLAVLIWQFPQTLGGFVGAAVILPLARRQRRRAEQALAANEPNGVLDFDTDRGG